MSRALTLILVVALAYGCGREGPSPDVIDPLPTSAISRSIEDVKWDTVMLIGGTESDTLLQIPRLITAQNGQVAAFDYGSYTVMVFGISGDLLWTFGRRGGGPGEFRGAFDLEFGPKGKLWVLDPTLNRLTVLDQSGDLDTVLSTASTRSASLVPRWGSALILTGRTDVFWLEMSGSGTVLATGPMPIQELGQVPGFARQPIADANSVGQKWVVVFPYGNILLSYQRNRFHCAGRLVEGDGFPARPAPDLPFWVAGVVVADSMAVVLAHGKSPDRLRVLDMYSLDDCSYRQSVRLPDQVSAITYTNGTYVFQVNDPAPALLGARMEYEQE